ncbi:MAG: hypothetical protein KQH59_18135 [Desulfobulbaceae bacterium]|nr:hypothetical protein [Desulfobulbaceae bacterium]
MAQTVLLNAVEVAGPSVTTIEVIDPTTFIMEGPGRVEIEKQDIAGTAYAAYNPDGQGIVTLTEQRREVIIAAKGVYRVNQKEVPGAPVSVAARD